MLQCLRIRCSNVTIINRHMASRSVKAPAPTAKSARLKMKQQAENQRNTTGSFQTYLPPLEVSDMHFQKALKKLKVIKIDKSISNVRQQKKKYAAMSLDLLMKELTVPITNSLYAYRHLLKNLHPYEATVAKLTFMSREKAGKPSLNYVVQRLKELRKRTSFTAKYFMVKLQDPALSSLDIEEVLLNGKKALHALYEDIELLEEVETGVKKSRVRRSTKGSTGGDPIAASEQVASSMRNILTIQRELRRIPVISLDIPSVVLVGCPNVGKSSIVRAVTTASPEVNNYPFTTRGVTMGHIIDNSRNLKFQVMDTPGLLDRPAEQRNLMEQLTFASLLHLPTAVIFVLDITELCGVEKSGLMAQLNVRKALKERFPSRPWIDVVSKSDKIVFPLTNEQAALVPEDAIFVACVVDEATYTYTDTDTTIEPVLLPSGDVNSTEVIAGDGATSTSTSTVGHDEAISEVELANVDVTDIAMHSNDTSSDAVVPVSNVVAPYQIDKLRYVIEKTMCQLRTLLLPGFVPNAPFDQDKEEPPRIIPQLSPPKRTFRKNQYLETQRQKAADLTLLTYESCSGNDVNAVEDSGISSFAAEMITVERRT